MGGVGQGVGGPGSRAKRGTQEGQEDSSGAWAEPANMRGSPQGGFTVASRASGDSVCPLSTPHGEA